jgi:hypothetical protein
MSEQNIFQTGCKFYIKFRNEKKFNNFDPINQKIHVNKIFHTYYSQEHANKIWELLKERKLAEEVEAIKMTNAKNKTLSIINNR